MVDAERRRRAEWTRPEPPAGLSDVDRRLASGQPVYGMLLRWATGREDWSTAVRHGADGVTLLLTPVADYLMVGQEMVDPDVYERALTMLDTLEPA